MSGEKQEGRQSRSKTERDWFVAVAIGLAAAFILIPPIIYFFWFRDNPNGGPGEWSDFASYFSGIATPVIAFCSALLFYRSIKVQRDEFQKTRKEMQDATKLQHDVEASRERAEEQKKLERIIPLIQKYRGSPLSTLENANKGLSIGYDEETHLKNYNKALKSYCDHGMHTINSIHEYLNQKGSVYIAAEWILNLNSEFYSITKALKGRDDKAKELYSKYRTHLDNLNERKEQLLDSLNQY